MAKQKIGEIRVERVKMDVVRKSLMDLGLPVDGEDPELIKRLVASQQKTPKNRMAECSNCNAASDIELPGCPFCGEGDEEQDTAEAVAANPNATVEPAKPVRVKPAKEPETEAEPKPRQKRSKAVDQAEPVAVTPDAIIPAGKLDIQPAKELDANVALIHKLKAEAVTSCWKLGMAIFENYDKRLYTQRTREDGSALYKTFNQFVLRELGLSPTHAFRYMDVAVNFTEEEVGTYGVGKLALVARIPEKDRAEVLEHIAQQNLSIRDVHREIRTRVGGNRRESTAATEGRGRFQGGVDGGAKGTATTAGKAEITVGIVLGKKTIQLMRGDAQDRFAATVQHDPVCTEQMLNGVTTHYRLIKNEKGLALVITRKREKEAPAPSSAPLLAKKRAKRSQKK